VSVGRLVPKSKVGEMGVDTEALLEGDSLPSLPALRRYQMPALRKQGEGMPEVQDLDALHQSPNSVQYQKDAPSEMTRRTEWTSSQSAGTADHGDVPVEDTDDRPETKGFGKRASVFPRLFAKTGGVNFKAIPPVLRRIRDHELFSQAMDQLEGQLTQTGFDKTIDFTKDEFDRAFGKKKNNIRKYAYVLEGHTTFQGLPISIENDKGSVRRGVDKDGKPWKTEMKFPYGYIDGTKGADGEEVDVYVGPDKDAEDAYVVQQRKKDTGEYDEDKVMLGFGSKEEAKDAFLAHYNSPKFLGPIKEVPMERLVELLQAKKKLTKIALDTSAAHEALDGVADKVTDFLRQTRTIKALKPVLGGLHSTEKKAFLIPPKRRFQ